jgi:TrmH family RNA methyltransferase
LGFNIHSLAIIKPAADIFDPKTIRASMGATFQLDFQYFESFKDYQKVFTNHTYAFMTGGKVELAQTSFKEPYALIFGSEASGLDSDFLDMGTSVRIPQNDTIDSLNLSVAVGIALYATQRQKP